MASNNEINRSDYGEAPDDPWRLRREARAKEQAERRAHRKTDDPGYSPRHIQIRTVRKELKRMLDEGDTKDRVWRHALDRYFTGDEKHAPAYLKVFVDTYEAAVKDEQGSGALGDGGTIEIKRHIVDGEEVFTREGAREIVDGS